MSNTENTKQPIIQKVYTKTDESGYEVERKRAQKINFAKFQELLQRNVSKTVSKTYTQYTRDLLDQYVQSPLNNIDNIREVSRFLTRVSMLYKQMISYFSTMPLYTYNITPLADSDLLFTQTIVGELQMISLRVACDTPHCSQIDISSFIYASVSFME